MENMFFLLFFVFVLFGFGFGFYCFSRVSEKSFFPFFLNFVGVVYSRWIIKKCVKFVCFFVAGRFAFCFYCFARVEFFHARG